MNIRVVWKIITLSQVRLWPFVFTGFSAAPGSERLIMILPISKRFQPYYAKASFLSLNIQVTEIANFMPLEH